MGLINYEVCDRCGKKIKKPIFPFVKYKTTVSITTLFGHGSFDYSSNEKVLCKKCARDLEEFMREGEMHETHLSARRPRP